MESLLCSAAALAAHLDVNRTSTDYPRDSTVHGQFELQAELWPDRPAVVDGDREISYRELNRLANGLAHALRAGGCGPGTTVGICVPRSAEMLVAVLGVLKNGGTFLPIDAGWPDQRVRQLVADAGCDRLICEQPAVVAAKVAGLGAEVLALRDMTRTTSDVNPQPSVRGDDVACVCYTSGSTGGPKGVMIPHRGIVRVAHFTAYGRTGPGSRVLQLGALTFDMAWWEIWSALLTGGTCVLYPAAPIDLSTLRQVLRAGRVTLAAIPTALFNLIVTEAPDVLAPVTTIAVGGEAQSPSHMAKALRAYGPGRVFNLYGPTESSCVATCYPVDEPPDETGPFPIGRPLQNTRLYVVSGDGRRLCEPGEVGELHLAGDGLAAGYLGAEELTRERFVHRRIGGVSERLYRTGDWGCLRPDGNVVFDGRRDDQVKVNGYRIELGEIANLLNAHPAVNGCFVTVQHRGDRGLLVAFVASGDQELTPDHLRQYLVARVPRYLVPAQIRVRSLLPLLPNGKVDRQALLAPSSPQS
ncbi:amino acid adenylation domain-containing protein [Lentzea sp. BCCO 10_0061]|uniref:Amino acid adenylation domain-containing protein n=1 Tax=Lentzea sokolovensis TaxID=3095429 RepID=A0ABU4VCG9_9PSEU|nr:amino acid adenylation domain-containing protein [Lentzea sp. BCCO 10_0061]MDX8149496.1 amino acid adenylation domain-containing protein [Lentzea sp. BCCO 10_0061]